LLVASLALVTGSALATPSQSDLFVRQQTSAAPGVLLAKGEQKKKAGGGREKFLTGEGRSKKGTKTKIDFDDAQIDGSRRTPTGVAITKNDPNREYDLINLRYHWKPEMIQSAAGLETGKGR
jgi:hypothetical protein